MTSGCFAAQIRLISASSGSLPIYVRHVSVVPGRIFFAARVGARSPPEPTPPQAASATPANAPAPAANRRRLTNAIVTPTRAAV